MGIKNIYLKDYRNIDELRLNFSDNLNIFVGHNGQGKTNIIEAIYMLLEGESFRFGEVKAFVQFDRQAAYLACDVLKNDHSFRVKMALEFNRKRILVNDKASAKMQQALPSAVLFSPESLSVIKEGSDERRQLIDGVVKSVYRQNVDLIFNFKKCLKTRNKLLKDISEKKIPYHEGLTTLHGLNQIFLKLATDLTSIRIDVLKSMRPLTVEILRNIDRKIPSEESVHFDFQYLISDENSELWDYDELYRIMQKRMAELESAEISFGASLVGPQKHDILFLYNGKDSRIFCSQGQQRSIILAFKMAQIVYHHKVNGFYPILLLDDVLSELDQAKQEALIKYLNQIKTQTFLTTTDIDVLKKLDTENEFRFMIQDGKVTG